MMVPWAYQRILVVMMSIALVIGTKLTKYDVYGKILTTGETINLGYLGIGDDYSSGYYVNNNTGNYPEFCVGIGGIDDHECIGVSKSASNLGFIINIKQNGDLGFIALSPMPEENEKPFSNPGIEQASQEQNIHIIKPSIIPSPNLKPNNIPKKQLQQTAKAATDISNTEEAPEQEKSWIQQNWMYIVPPLLILFVLLGDDEKK